MARKQPDSLGDPAIEVLMALGAYITDDVAGRSPTLRRLAVSCCKAVSTTYERIQDLNRLGYVTDPPYKYGMYGLTALGWELFESAKAKRTLDEQAEKIIDSSSKVNSNTGTKTMRKPKFEDETHPGTKRQQAKKGGLKNYVSSDE